jgi:hypothetical protein
MQISENSGTTTGITVSNCIFYGNDNDGVSVDTSEAVVFNDCSVYDNGIAGAGADGDGFSIATSVVTLNRCSIYGNPKTAFSVSGASTLAINNCIVSRIGTAPTGVGLLILSEDTTSTIYNSTFYLSTTTKDIISISTTNAGGALTAKNNIFYGGEQGIDYNGDSSITIVEENNLFYGFSGAAVEGFVSGSTLTNNDPKFIAVGSDYRLGPGSSRRRSGWRMGMRLAPISSLGRGRTSGRLSDTKNYLDYLASFGVTLRKSAP